MWPPIEAGSPKQLFGIPVVIWWGILTGCLIVLLVALFILFLLCWFLPRRRRKSINLTQDSLGESNGSAVANAGDITGKSELFLFFRLVEKKLNLKFQLQHLVQVVWQQNHGRISSTVIPRLIVQQYVPHRFNPLPHHQCIAINI